MSRLDEIKARVAAYRTEFGESAVYAFMADKELTQDRYDPVAVDLWANACNDIEWLVGELERRPKGLGRDAFQEFAKAPPREGAT